MNTTYGDLLREASEQMDLAIRLAIKGTVHGPAAVATISASRQVSGILVRYVDNLIPTAPLPQRGLTRIGIWAPLQDPHTLLRETHQALSRLEDELTSRIAPAAHPVARHLSAAALALGAGRDLLNTHFSSDPGPTDWTNAIVHPDTRRALLAAMADQAKQLAAVLQHTRPALRGLGLSHTDLDRSIIALTTPSSTPSLMDSTSGSRDATLTAIPLRGLPTVDEVPEQPESIGELCRGIIDDAEAIRTLISADTTAFLTAQEWQRHATGAAATMHSAVHAMALLLRRANEIHPTGALEIKNVLRTSYRICDQMFQKWQAVRHSWEPLTTATHKATPSRLQRPLKNLVTRMARLVSSDPTWTIGDRKASTTKSPAELAPTIADMPRLVLAVQHATEALLVLAQHDLTNIANAAASGRLFTRRQTARGKIYAPASHSHTLNKLQMSYRQVIAHSSASFMPLRKAALSTSPSDLRSSIAERITILRRRRIPAHVAKMYQELEKSRVRADKKLDADKKYVVTAAADSRLSAADSRNNPPSNDYNRPSRPTMHQNRQKRMP